MKATFEIHPIQARIIRVLLFKPEVRFSDLNTDKIPTDHFNFHLQSLVDSGLLLKSNNGKYQLTTVGKEFANRMDEHEVKIEKQAKIGILLVCINDQVRPAKYLVQERLKQPYFGYHGFPGGKVKLGETLQEAAKRELKEETELSGEVILAAYRHKMDYSKEGKLLEDKNFFIFRVTKITGSFKPNFEGGKNIWLTKKEINVLPKRFDDVLHTLEIALKKSPTFVEKKYIVSGF